MSWSPPEDEVVKIKDEFLDGLARLETAGGKKTIKGPGGIDSNNLYNIKDNSGKGFRAHDKAEGSNDAYRTYASHDESKKDVVSLLARRYPGALEAKTPEEFAAALKKGGYATDPNYVQKLTGTIKKVKNTNTWAPPDDEIATQGAWSPPEDEIVTGSAAPAQPAVQKQAPYTASPRETGMLDNFATGTRGAAAALAFMEGIGGGTGKKIAAGIDSVINGTKYDDELAKRKAQIEVNKAANPGTFGTVELASSLPMYIGAGGAATIGKAALGGAGVGALQGVGAAEGSLEDQAKQVALSSIIGGTAVGAGKALASGAGSLITKYGGGAARTAKDLIAKMGLSPGAANNVAGSIARNASGPSTVMPAVVAGGMSDTSKRIGTGLASAGGAAAMGAGPAASFSAGVTGALLGPTLGGKVAQKVGQGALRAAGTAPARAAGTGLSAVTQAALVNMTKPQAKKAVATGDAQIQEAVANGQPEYAAQFSALQNPVYRQASAVEKDEDDKEDDDE